MKTFSPVLTLAVAFTAFSPAALRAAEPKIEETVVGPANDGGSYFVSNKLARVAHVAAKGTRLAVVVDGVEGPVIDELIGGSPFATFAPNKAASVYKANHTWKGIAGTPSAVLFSEDGKHFAYMARQGSDYIVIHDGKEIGRGPRLALGLNQNPISLSPQGKFVTWGEMKTEASRGSWKFFVNGKAGPTAGHQDFPIVYSADESRYAYTAATVEDYKKSVLVVDGKVASYNGYNPQFTADSKILLTQAPGNVVLVDGKPLGVTGIQLEKITPAPVGSRFAVIVRKRPINSEGVGTLYLDGKEVAGTDGAVDISFSPDGKRYALRCRNPEAKSFFMIIDGKKGSEYQSIWDKVFWTPDSSKVIYHITSGGRNFVVVNTEEFPVQSVAALNTSPIPMPAKGNRYAFTSVDGTNRNFLVVVDGKQVLPPGIAPDGASFTFSADGSRYAYVARPVGRNEIIGLVVDGTLSNELAVSEFGGMGWMNPATNVHFQFSADGKYLARMARKPDNTNAGLYLNDKLVYPTTYRVAQLTFSPDSKHVAWVAAEKFPDRPQLYSVAYVDGYPVVKFSGDNFQSLSNSWEMGADGVLTFIAAAGDVVKRYRITPAADMDIEKVIGESQQRQARAIAAAAAAKLKAEQAAAAAKTKADEEKADAMAKAKADADEKAAKRKADLQAAAEAKAKARADAAAAKAAARQKQ
ncbi:TolB family protein [Horticoccus sp. 23ND18S-11]|uniref:TolB family protein n=1 Tax=Horticoccus sp. 23ND18S-11 TaxID=3391832 RepID=UPI0039C94744